MKKFDFIIIGGGAAAFAAAIKANELGATTAMIQGPLPLGGTCVNVGCVPSKSLVHAAELVHATKKIHPGGIKLSLESFDFAKVIKDELDLVAALRKQKYEEVLSNLPQVTLIEGIAKFVNPNEIKVGKDILSAKKFLIATGTTALAPKIPGLAKAGYLTHVPAISRQILPKSLLVLGSGAVGLEFSQIFARFGSAVTLVARGESLYKNTEPELNKALEQVFADEKIKVLKNTVAVKVEVKNKLKVVTLKTGDQERTISVEDILVATGKTPNTSTLGLDNIGVELDKKGAVVASPTFQTSADHIYVAGDVSSLPMRLETTAGKEGSLSAQNALQGTKHTIDYLSVPWTVFTAPQLAGVGLLDEDTSKHGLSCTCNTVSFKHLAKAQILGDTRGVIKMVMDRQSRRIVGVHILADNAGDIIGQAALVIKNKMTVDEVLETMPVFPTLSESIKIGAISLVTDISKVSCCI
ncbi:mercury(II) reductase [Patescibacteria group bacterium]|nr:mercury(II) reductase [Patescibacteria group bacterium]